VIRLRPAESDALKQISATLTNCVTATPFLFRLACVIVLVSAPGVFSLDWLYREQRFAKNREAPLEGFLRRLFLLSAVVARCEPAGGHDTLRVGEAIIHIESDADLPLPRLSSRIGSTGGCRGEHYFGHFLSRVFTLDPC